MASGRKRSGTHLIEIAAAQEAPASARLPDAASASAPRTNAIIQAALHGISTRGATCYVTHLPCINCTKALINAGIARIVYSVSYRTDENAMMFLKAANIEVEHKEFTPVP